MPEKPDIQVNLLRIQKHPKQSPPVHKSTVEEKKSMGTF